MLLLPADQRKHDDQAHGRRAREPGGNECSNCGYIFIGEEWHDDCACCAAFREYLKWASLHRKGDVALPRMWGSANDLEIL